MKTINLTNGGVALVDDSDYETVVAVGRWRRMETDNKQYAIWNSRKNGKPVFALMHRLILGDPAQFTDHIDGDGLNNQRSNLRPCSPGQNQYNRRLNLKSKSGFKGVQSVASSPNWRVRIGFRGKRIYGGVFPTKQEAARKYNELALQYFGEFARLNPV